MEDRYYNPKIEELHIGFECEIDQSEINKNFKWCEYVIGTDYENITIARAVSEVNKNGIRVKYLDRQDIESFGFKFDAIRSKVIGNFAGQHDSGLYYLDYSPYNYKEEFNDKVHLRILKVKDVPGNAEFKYAIENYQYVFDGIIKNKSALKKLLIQLGINNE